jgi:hypothetical protein
MTNLVICDHASEKCECSHALPHDEGECITDDICAQGDTAGLVVCCIPTNWNTFKDQVDKFVGMSSSFMKISDRYVRLRYGNPFKPILEVIITEQDNGWHVTNIKSLLDESALKAL